MKVRTCGRRPARGGGEELVLVVPRAVELLLVLGPPEGRHGAVCVLFLVVCGGRGVSKQASK
jgi:hypothetical protein